MTMIEASCESVCLATMATLDGHESELTHETIENHLANCPQCREEVKQMRAIDQLLGVQERREQTADVWPAVRARITVQGQQKTTSSTWLPFMVLGLLLFAYWLLELIPQLDLGMMFKIVPVLIVIAIFIYVKENPFKINAELRLEGE
jgi:predicted anti-sigma-YlaC factor YlaD